MAGEGRCSGCGRLRGALCGLADGALRCSDTCGLLVGAAGLRWAPGWAVWGRGGTMRSRRLATSSTALPACRVGQPIDPVVAGSRYSRLR